LQRDLLGFKVQLVNLIDQHFDKWLDFSIQELVCQISVTYWRIDAVLKYFQAVEVNN
jgi:hypothetical protein